MKILLFVLLLSLVSCGKNLGSNEEGSFKLLNFSQGKISFSLLQSSVLAPQCLRCHAWMADEEEVLSRVVPGSPQTSPLFLLVQSGAMPVGGPELSDQEKEAISQFIIGLSEPGPPTPDPTPLPTPSPPAKPYDEELFAQMKSEILMPRCLACHAWINQDEQLFARLSAGDPEGSKLYAFVANNSMPLGGPPLETEDKDLIRDFILTMTGTATLTK